MDSDPGLPTFFSTVLVCPSPKENDAAVISPSRSIPEQVRVIAKGALPELGLTVSPVHSGVSLDRWVGEGVGVGVAVGCGVGVGVAVGTGVVVTVGVTVGVIVAIANASVQAGAIAFGFTWGTVGATGLVWVNF